MPGQPASWIAAAAAVLRSAAASAGGAGEGAAQGEGEEPVISLDDVPPDAGRAGVALPALRVGVTARDGRPLRRLPPTRLEVRLLRWQEAEEERQQQQQQQQQQRHERQAEGSRWVPVEEYRKTLAPIRSFGSRASGAAVPGGGDEAGPSSGGGGGGGGGADAARRGVVPAFEAAEGALRVPPRPGRYKWVLHYPAEGLAVPDVEMGPVRVAAGGPRRLRVAGVEAGVEPQLEFVARPELRNRSFPGAAVFLADAFGNPARFGCLPPQLLLRGGAAGGRAGGGAEGEGGGAGAGAAERPAKRARNGVATASPAIGGGADVAFTDGRGWELIVHLRHQAPPPAPGDAAPPRQSADWEILRAPLDAAGRGAVPQLPLARLPLAESGVYVIVGRAQRHHHHHQQQQQQQQQQQRGGDGDGGGGGGRSGAEVVVVEAVLAQFQIASADAASLLSQLSQARSALRRLRDGAVTRRRDAGGLQAEAARAEGAAAAAEAEVAELERSWNALQAQCAVLLQSVENAVQQRVQLGPQQPSPLLLVPRNAPHTLLPAALAAAHLAGGVLGRVICLGSVERSDVNRTICSILGGSVYRIACVGEAGTALARRHWPDVGRWDLANPDMATSFTCAPAAPAAHLQRPLAPPPDLVTLCDQVLDLHNYQPGVGFVGLAANLIHLTQEQLAVTVDVAAAAHPGRPHTLQRPANGQPLARLGLRQTLWHYLLRNCMLFETSQHMTAFRQALRARGRGVPPWLKLYSLDGDSYNKMIGLEEAQGRAYQGPLFSGVPAAANAAAPLDLRLKYLQELSDRAHQQHGAADHKRQEAAQRRAEAAAARAAAQEAAARLDAAQRELAEEEGGLAQAEGRLVRELVQLGEQPPPQPPPPGEGGVDGHDAGGGGGGGRGGGSTPPAITRSVQAAGRARSADPRRRR
ncbi:hypothetical protein MNEG_11171 [Monoraphidium neglectum]|uniref:Uncharacterized protein n=1 Tax=Monoraphidium neglectum TaxID=145388 RepID=A0A0D2JAM9_9CHLO|nr:hypothetical protein MNEG_11171 [Monoraphidium neglectum]KIY96792.1 hypothetical protein MNEG_11171 [Monoraphidium neglectum]|eukprot:XP_013895812.1 hypothetical protein MNEG_11171 [Monoraphidium neglectum]